MSASSNFLGPSEAARRLGVSVKALRIYEAQGLIAPTRTSAGWRAYGPADMARASEIVALRALGLGLKEIAQTLTGGSESLEQVLARHEVALEVRLRALEGRIARVRSLRRDIAVAAPRGTGEPMSTPRPDQTVAVAFALPWPWAGERFALREVTGLTYITGPLFSGKTKLARCLAETLPGAAFVGLDRLEGGGARARSTLDADPAFASRVERTLSRLARDGADISDALFALIAALETEGHEALVIDMIEEGLDEPTQAAVARYLRRRESGAKPVFQLTRSSAILDLASVGPDETVILCPANHSPPIVVAPHPGAVGYEAVATCLASPAVRARSAGVVVTQREVA